MCFKATKTTSEQSQTTSAPPWLTNRYKNLVGDAYNVSQTPFSQPQQQIADFSGDQNAAFQNVRDQQGNWTGNLTAANNYATLGAAPISTQDILAGYSPYIDAQVAATQNDFNVQNQRELASVNSNAAKMGALTGDRSQVAAALAQESQRRTQDPVLANIRQQGFRDAQALAEGNRTAAMQGAQAFQNLASSQQQLGYNDVNAQLQTGGMQQGLNQARNDAQYNWEMAKAAYPFETTQWYAGILGSATPAAGSKSTGTTTTPGPSKFGQIAGAATGLLGAYMMSDERVKENIVQIGADNAGMPIYRYNYLGDDPSQTQIGYIAQDVEQVMPEAVMTGPDGMKRVDYAAATAPATVANMEGMAGGGVANGQGSDPDFARLTTNLGAAIEAIRGHSAPGADDYHRGYAEGGVAMAGQLPKAQPQRSVVPKMQLQAGAPMQAQLPQPQQAPAQDTTYSDLGKAVGGYLGKKFNAPDVALHDWGFNTSVTPAANGGRVGMADGGALSIYPDSAALGLIDAIENPNLGMMPKPVMTMADPGAFNPNGGIAMSIPPPASSYPVEPRRSVVPGMTTSEGSVSYVPNVGALPQAAPEAMGAMQPSAAMGPPPAPDNGGWETTVTPEAGPQKAWYEYGSNPQLGEALLAAGAGMMSSDSPHWHVQAGQGLATALGHRSAQRAKEREYAMKEREADRQAQILSNQMAQFRMRQDLDEKQASETERHNRETERIAGLANAAKPLTMETVFDPETGRERKAIIDQRTGDVVQYVGGIKSDTADTTLSREEAKEAVRSISNLKSAADASRGMLADVADMRRFRQGLDYEGGVAPEFRTMLGKQLGGLLGWLPLIPSSEEAAAGESVISKAQELQLAFTNQTKGAISDSEMRMFGAATPGINMSDEAAEPVLMAIEAGNKRTIERAKFYEAYLGANRTLRGADEAWDTYVHENPVLVPNKESGGFMVNEANIGNWKNYVGGDASAEGAAAPAASAPSASPPPGTPDNARQAPDGNWYVPDPARPGKYLKVEG